MKKEWLKVRVTQVTEVVIEGVDLLEEIRKLDAKDNKVIKAVEKIKQAEVKMLRDEKWREENGLILRDRKIYILQNKKLRAEVIWLHHNTFIGEHRR